MVTTNDLRGLLDDAWDDAPDGALTLREQLRAKEREARAGTAGGSISSISRNQSSQTIASGGSNMTLIERANAFRQLVDLYDVLAEADPDEAVIYPEMKRRLVPVSEFTREFTGLHCA